MTSLSSMSSVGTPHHHQSLRGKQLENPRRQLGSSRAPRVPRPFGKCREHHCFHPKACATFFHPKQHGSFPDRLKLPYPDEEILSGYEEDVSSIRDGFTPWVKAEFKTVLERRTVDLRKVHAEFREASPRRHVTSYQEYHFDNNVLHLSPVQKRLSIYNWNPGPRRGKEGAVEKQIPGRWHVITLQVAIAYVDHEHLTNRFHVTYCGGGVQCCSIRTLSFLTSRSNPSTFTTSGTIYRTRFLKENQVG